MWVLGVVLCVQVHACECPCGGPRTNLLSFPVLVTFFLGGEGKSRVYCVCVRAYAVEAAWKSQDEFNGVNMYMNAEHQFSIGA